MLLNLIAVSDYALGFILHCPITRKRASLRRRSGLEYKSGTGPFKNIKFIDIGTACFMCTVFIVREGPGGSPYDR